MRFLSSLSKIKMLHNSLHWKRKDGHRSLLHIKLFALPLAQ